MAYSLTSVNIIRNLLTYIKSGKICKIFWCSPSLFVPLYTRYENQQYHTQDIDASGAWCGHPLLDVPRRGLATAVPRDDRRDGLDVDAVVVPLWYIGTDV